MSHDTVFEMKGRTSEEVNRCREWLRVNVPAGRVIGTLVRHVSRSGMMRRVSLYAAIDNEVVCIDYYASRALGKSMTDEGIRYDGCGFSATDEAVSDLAMAIHGGVMSYRSRGI